MKTFLHKAFDIPEKIFKWIFSSFKNFFIVLLVIMCTYFFFSWKTAERDFEKEKTEWSDTLTVYKNKQDELYAEREISTAEKRDLKEKQEELYNEIKKLKDNPITITKIETVTEIDSIYIRDTVYQTSDREYRTDFLYKDEWSEFSGYSAFNLHSLSGTTVFNRISFNSSIWVSIIEKDKKTLSLIARSDNPYLKINNLNGSVISPEDSKLLRQRYRKPWGISAGIGVSTTYYNNRIIAVPAIQITLGYQFISF